jgi:hypothetical protein
MLGLGAIMLGLLLLPPVFGLWRYRTQRRHVQLQQRQIRSFHSWSTFGKIAGHLVLSGFCLILMIMAFRVDNARRRRGCRGPSGIGRWLCDVRGAIWSYLRARRHALLGALEMRKAHPGRRSCSFARLRTIGSCFVRRCVGDHAGRRYNPAAFVSRTCACHCEPGEKLPPLGAARDYVCR